MEHVMNAAVAIWLVLRVSRWLFWIGFFAYSLHFVLNRQVHLNSFGHLLLGTEAALFGFGVMAVFAGFLELMMRERAGLPRPSFGQLIPPTSTETLNPIQ
jgi:hypothetical protein